MDSGCSKKDFDRIQFNVSGTLFETLESTLQRFPTTLLGSIEKRSLLYCDEAKQHFIDRNRIAFEAILFFYQSFGRLIRPNELPMELFEAECEYFQIPQDIIDSMKLNEGYIPSSKQEIENPTRRNYFFWSAWEAFEHPDSSKFAYASACTSAIMLSVSIFVICAQSALPVKVDKGVPNAYYWIDFVCASWFTIEYLTRLIVCPNRRKFIRSFMNVIDFLASFPYLVFLISGSNFPLFLVRISRVIRLIRLLQLTGSPARLALLQSVILSSLRDLGLLFLCLLIVVFIGGSIMYIVEMDSKSSAFTSIPQSFWWGIQTVVVLGYGDIVPTTVPGKIVASFFMIFGALTISLPVLSVVSKLVKIYDRAD